MEQSASAGNMKKDPVLCDMNDVRVCACWHLWLNTIDRGTYSIILTASHGTTLSNKIMSCK